jgi:hypothetical protein
MVDDVTWLYVTDLTDTELHVVEQSALLPTNQSWTLCGRWPLGERGWHVVLSDRGNLMVHDVCRYWAGMGRQWHYARDQDTDEWHVLPEVDDPAEAVALCGQRPPRSAHWGVLAANPTGHPLHAVCRARRDEEDSWRPRRSDG